MLFYSKDAYAALIEWYNATLSALPVLAESLFVPTRFGETHVVAVGRKTAPALVLLHDWNENALAWAKQLADLARHFRVYAPDTIGQAGRSAPVRPPLNTDAYGLWLKDTFEQLNLKQADVVGASGGAWLAIKLSSVAPELLRRVALLNPTGFILPRPSLDAMWAMLTAWWSPTQTNIENVIRTTSGPQAVITSETLSAYRHIFQHYRLQAAPSHLRRGEIGQLSALTLLLLGECDYALDAEATLRRARRLLPNLHTATVLPGLGHHLHDEAPRLLTVQLQEFFQVKSEK